MDIVYTSGLFIVVVVMVLVEDTNYLCGRGGCFTSLKARGEECSKSVAYSAAVSPFLEKPTLTVYFTLEAEECSDGEMQHLYCLQQAAGLAHF